MAITRLAPGEADLQIDVLRTEPRVVLLPMSHPLAERTELRLGDLRDESFITLSPPQPRLAAHLARRAARARASGGASRPRPKA